LSGMRFVIALAAESWSNKWFVSLANDALFVLMLGTILAGRPDAEARAAWSG
jgi:hypothetical protein